jgi:hypothetical protein
VFEDDAALLAGAALPNHHRRIEGTGIHGCIRLAARIRRRGEVHVLHQSGINQLRREGAAPDGGDPLDPERAKGVESGRQLRR